MLPADHNNQKQIEFGMLHSCIYNFTYDHDVFISPFLSKLQNTKHL